MTDTLYKYVLVYAFMHTKNTLIDSKNILFNIDSTMKTKHVLLAKNITDMFIILSPLPTINFIYKDIKVYLFAWIVFEVRSTIQANKYTFMSL
jgi:hypothetical protein